MFTFQSDFDIIKRVNVGITVSDYTNSPEFILHNDTNGTFDGKKRWAASGVGQWMDFKFDQDIVIYGLNIAWYSGNERQQSFKIYANNRLIFNGLSKLTSEYQIYKFNECVLTDNLRITCFGNNINQLNEISAVAFRCEPITEETVPEVIECPSGQHWNEVLQKCVSDTIDQPPFVMLTNELVTVKQGNRVLLDGSQSYDPSNTPISFEWIQTGGELVGISSNVQPTLLFKAPTIDTEITFRLKVTNVGGLWATKDAKILVKADLDSARLDQAIKKLDAMYLRKDDSDKTTITPIKEFTPTPKATRTKRSNRKQE